VTNRLIYQRREFMTLLGGAAASWPVAARAQQAGKLPTIGILGSGTPAGHGQWYAGFVQRLRELGWTEGRNLAIEYRWAEGRSERFAEIVAEFARLRIDVIATSGTAAVAAAKQATSTIPIVFAAAGDPVGTGLVASLAKPGGNVTGLSLQQSDLAGKRLEILREAVPGLRRLAIMGNAGTAGSLADMSETEDAARKLNLGSEGLSSVAAKISSLYLILWRATPTRSMSLAIRWSRPIGCVLMFWRSAHAYPPCTRSGRMPPTPASSPTGPTSRTCFGAPAIWWTRFYVVQSRATFRWSNRPSSTW
jgi:hypothetical protein